MSKHHRGHGTFRRHFDDGSAILVLEPPGEDGTRKLLEIAATVCDNPDCTLVHLEATPLSGSDPEGDHEPEGPAVEATLDLEARRLTWRGSVEAGSPAAATRERLKAALDREQVALLRARLHRARHQDDADEWRSADWRHLDREALVPYLDVFPSRWDLGVVWRGAMYWALDHWCLKPGCSCTDVVIQFLGPGGKTAGSVVVDTDSGQAGGGYSDETGLALWDALLADGDVLGELRLRREAMRRVARELPAFLGEGIGTVVSGARVGRNDPCPCGSGKKSKRCCG